MRITKTLKNFTVAFACAGLLGGQLAQAAAPIQDVALQSGGRLVGQVVDGESVPQAGVPLAVVSNGEAIAKATTDSEGRFEVRGLTAGVYSIQTANSGTVYRVWTPNATPPHATAAALVINERTVVRGQPSHPHFGGGGGLGGHFAWLANPWVLAAIVAAAIAIPLAVDGDAS